MKTKLTLGTYKTVQFFPSGDVERRSIRWIIANGGLLQLQEIRRGVKLDAPIFGDAKRSV